MATGPDSSKSVSDQPTTLSDAPVAALRAGVRVGGYRLEDLIASGGMATVYRARDERLGRTVALKVLKHAGAGDLRDRFLREVRLVAGLQHPNIVMLFGAGEEADVVWAAMELLPRSLADELRANGKLAVSDACTAARDACLGLEAAAARGIVHRDVKPSNLLRDHSGAVKVADFGLAKDLSADLHLTTPGVILGTPLYSSPEQAMGKEVGIASDLYSLGATLYHLVTGRPPFESSSPLDTLVRHAIAPPPPLPPEIPGPVSRLIHALLAKDPAQRPAGYAEVIARLDGQLDAGAADAAAELPPMTSPVDRGSADGVSASMLGAARAAIEMGRHDRARTLLEPIVQKQSGAWVAASFLLAAALEHTQKYAEASKVLEAVASRAASADDRALALWTLGRIAEQESAAALTRAVDIYARIQSISSTRFPKALLDARIERLQRRQKQEGSSASHRRDPQST